MSRKNIQESKARIDIYSSSYKPSDQTGRIKRQPTASKREGGGQIASIDIPFAQLVQTSPADPKDKSDKSTLNLIENSKAMYWSALCINGRTTLNDIYAINQLTHSRPDVSKICQSEVSHVMRRD